jgi:hypothetical protein
VKQLAKKSKQEGEMATAKKVAAKKTATKKTAKRPAAKRPATRRPTAKKAAMKRSAKVHRPQSSSRLERYRGYKPLGDGVILVPDDGRPGNIVPPDKLAEGLSKAQRQIRKAIEEMVKVMTMNFSIHEIEFSASFSADGKFLGFGVGGEASIKVTIRPDESDGGE